AGQGQRRAGHATDGFHAAVQDGRAVGRTVKRAGDVGRPNGLTQNRKRTSWAGFGFGGACAEPISLNFNALLLFSWKRPTSALSRTHNPMSPRNWRPPFQSVTAPSKLA